ncbi:PQQ-binding-like beta-propeller repeat protein [Halohasta salina]|uniref:outer membrane protein assembly factor BamB family protein n=1 Tax=Halohasta salina TaxID=2961621 RepID=UPI0020A5D234|nr:PQQ-binding-like beta-propeller repeat protein [Halohasta salina]
MKRRELLATVSAATVSSAGCVSGGGTGILGESSGRRTDAEGAAPSGDAVDWTYRTGGSVRHRPTLRDGIVYVGGGENGNATSQRKHVRPERSENVYALSADTGSEQWRYEASAGVASSPIVSDGVFVVVGWNAGTHGIDQRLVRLDDGAEMWSTRSRDRFRHLLAVRDGTAYLGTSDDEFGLQGEELSAVHTGDGDQRWAIEAGDTTAATVDGETLYAVEGSRRTTAYAVSDGAKRWQKAMRPATDGPRVFDDTLYLVAERTNEHGNYPVVAVAAADGTERWRFSVPVDEPFVPTGAVVSGATVCITEYGGWLFGVDPSDGTERWRYSTDGETRDAPMIGDGLVYVVSRNDGVHAVDVTTGERQWKQPVAGQARFVAGNRQGLIVRGGRDEGDQQLRAYAPDGTERWSFSHAGAFTRPAVDGTRALIGTKTGYVAAVGEPDGRDAVG